MHHVKPVITNQKGKQRTGKGFSPTEIKKSGLNLGEARKLKLPIDFKRKSSHEENIETLKQHISTLQTGTKTAETAQALPVAKAETKKKPKS